MADKEGPAMQAGISELQAVFASDEALQAAMGELQRAGFDRADLSLPTAMVASGENTPDQGADAPMTDDDTRQARTLGTSMAGTVGAIAAAAATVATGGAAAVAIAAAVAVGAGAAAAAHSVADVAKQGQEQDRDAAASRGQLVLAVRTPDRARANRAEQIFRAAGATRIQPIMRRDASLVADATGWTG